MKLSIIIVNYNVKHFLKQCLNSSLQAAKTIEHEIICVDNNSVDGSVEMMDKEFPSIQLIRNNENLGFAKACNQGIKEARGQYVLILNPDTVLERDSLTKPIQFMDDHIEAGSLGVKMVDGNGKYLPESKRGLPTPAAAFYKMSGISKIFYPSKTFGKYHLDYLNKDEIHSVHVLTGAYMLIRKSALEKVGLFDEQYFMYGEDIDLSHRIILGGYKNYYFPETSIIHYKGESTKKESLHYVFNFYTAMLIFAKKYYSKQNAWSFSMLIKIAILTQAFLAFTNRLLYKFLMPIVDLAILILGLSQITGIWASQFTYPDGGSYPLIFYQLVIPTYGLIWVIINFFAGTYDKPYKTLKIISGMVLGTIVILLGYSLLPESWRFSRSIILLGSLWGILSLISIRWILRFLGLFKTGLHNQKRILIIGGPQEAERIHQLLDKNDLEYQFVAYVSPHEQTYDHPKQVGTLSQIRNLIKILEINELIFCSKDISYQSIINEITNLQTNLLSCKIAPEDGFSIIGSKSLTSFEDLYFQKINSIGSSMNKRKKRMLDVSASLILIVTIPINIFFISNILGFFKNLFYVLLNQKSWVGCHPETTHDQEFISLKKGILYVTDGIKGFQNDPNTISRANTNYIKNYSFWNDLYILYYGFKKLGRL